MITWNRFLFCLMFPPISVHLWSLKLLSTISMCSILNVSLGKFFFFPFDWRKMELWGRQNKFFDGFIVTFAREMGFVLFVYLSNILSVHGMRNYSEAFSWCFFPSDLFLCLVMFFYYEVGFTFLTLGPWYKSLSLDEMGA